MDNNREYYAFISYKREDEKWAKWLQHKLEHYRFPTNLSGSEDKTVRIWDFPPLQDLIDETRKRFKDRQLTPEERKKYYLE